LGLLIIFFCYSVLTMYVISFTDRGAPNIEIIFQSLIYIVTEAFFLWFYYKDILIKDQEYKY